MFINYLKIAIRSVYRQKFYAFINITGLALGLATGLLILLYIIDEFNYDTFHEDARLIYRVNLLGRMSGQEFNSCYTSSPVTASFVEEIPEVEVGCRIAPWEDINVTYLEDAYSEKTVLLADSNFFDFFSFRLTQGDPKTVLTKPFSLVLTETAANKIFGYTGLGDNSPVGKELVFGIDKWTCTVTGITEDPPSNSHFHFSMILSMGSWDYSRSPVWVSNSLLTYLKLNENADWRSVEDKFPELVKKYIGPQVLQFLGISIEEFFEQGGAYGFYLQPLLDIHFSPEIDHHLEPGGNMNTIYLLTAIVLFIIVIACINFMNLSTARFSGRAKEVGVRKSLGGSVTRLRIQFLIESVFYTLVSMVLAQVVLILVLPGFNSLSGKQLSIDILYDLEHITGMVLLVLIVGLLAGSYPAFYLTSFKPVEILRGRIKAGMKSAGIRSVLVVFQFTLSIVLIVGTLLIYKQLMHLQKVGLGFEKENVLVIRNAESLGNNKITFKEELLNLPEIVNASIVNLAPPEGNYSDIFRPRGEDTQERGANYFIVDEDYQETLGLTLIDGRFFSRDFPSDSGAVVINEAAAKLFGWDKPVGQKLQTFWKENDEDVRGVIGVIKDYNFQSLKKEITSLVIFMGSQGNNLLIKLSPGEVTDKISIIRSKWKTFAPGVPFDYSFIEDDFNAKFRKEQQLGRIFMVFTCLAIIIACLGLLGLATFTAEQRSKEIGIRKALGSSTRAIMKLLLSEYLKLIAVSFLLAIPVSYIVITWWLNNFPYRINIGALSFLIGGIISLFAAIISISFQSLRAAAKNPVDSLRYE